MSARPVQFGHNGAGRVFGYGQGPLVSRGSVPGGYVVDTGSIATQRANMLKKGKTTLMPITDDFRLLSGEMAFKIRGRSGVITALNGLDVAFVEAYPGQPDVVAALLESIIQPIGVVQFDVAPSGTKANPPVTLIVGGSVPQGSPCLFNRPGQEKAHITLNSRVIYGVPNLQDPLQFGTTASGRPVGKVGLVARGQNTGSFGHRATLMIGALINDPAKFRKGLKDHKLVANSWANLGFRVLKSYKVAALMLIDLLLKRGVLYVNPAALELLDPRDNTTELSSEETVAQIAKLLGVLDSRSAYATLSARQRGKWKEISFEANGRMTMAPLGASGYNSAHEFGFGFNEQTGQWVSKARAGQTGEIQNTAIGDLLKLQVTHLKMLFESCLDAMHAENTLSMGIALTVPSLSETCVFDLLLQPHGGLTDIE